MYEQVQPRIPDAPLGAAAVDAAGAALDGLGAGAKVLSSNENHWHSCNMRKQTEAASKKLGVYSNPSPGSKIHL